MTESAAASPIPELVPESFWSILIRRGRYLIAMSVAAIVFLAVGWRFIAPPPEMAGVSLFAWSPAGSLLGAAALCVLLIIVGLVCTILVHPDAPHMGLFCAIAGMATLSIRGGTSQMLVQASQLSNVYPATFTSLALECFVWALLFLIAETIIRIAHDRYFSNTHWITRSGSGLAEHAVKPFSRNGGEPIGVSLAVSQAFKTKDLHRGISMVLAMIYSGLVAFLLLFIFLQSQLKGQVLFGCFVAFFLSTGNAYLAFPRVPAIAFFVAVLLTASAGFFAAAHYLPIYPGQGGLFISRALPFDFFVAGIPGAILGYYAAVRWSLHSHEHA